ncbi:hypothetical protein HN873_068227, partial [Arachis hypogaea]
MRFLSSLRPHCTWVTEERERLHEEWKERLEASEREGFEDTNIVRLEQDIIADGVLGYDLMIELGRDEYGISLLKTEIITLKGSIDTEEDALDDKAFCEFLAFLVFVVDQVKGNNETKSFVFHCSASVTIQLHLYVSKWHNNQSCSDLSYNFLEGAIPESLGENLNGNRLSGSVPASLGGRLLHRASFNFTDNRGLCGIPSLPSCGRGLSGGDRAGIGLGVSFMAVALVGGGVSLLVEKAQQHSESSTNCRK